MRALPNRVHVRRVLDPITKISCDGCNRTATVAYLVAGVAFSIATRHARACNQLLAANIRDAARCWACMGEPEQFRPCIVCDAKGWLPTEHPSNCQRPDCMWPKPHMHTREPRDV